ncbi:MAG: hypothetical protein R3F54_12600 [Alphaproteobacteria bacterium]
MSLKRGLVSVVVLGTAILSAGLEAGKASAEQAGMTAMLEGDYPYLVVDQALPDALRELGHNLDIAVDVSPAIGGRVRHYDHGGTAADFLAHLASEHQLDWVIDQGRLFISTADEQTAKSWSGGAGAYEAVKAALAHAGIDDPRFPLGFDSGRGEVNLSAPPRYMALATPVIDRALAPKATRTVNVIHGRAREGGT